MKKGTRRRLDMPGYDPRDFVRYGRNPAHPQWPGGARIAMQMAVHYEAGGEDNIPYGDAHSEGVLYMLGRDKVWIARGDEIAQHWIARFPKPERVAGA